MSCPGVIELLVVGATLTIAAWAAGAQAHRKSSASRSLERYARSRGLVFVPTPDGSPHASPRVVGARDEVRWEVDLYRLSGEMRTRVSAVPARGQAPILSVLQRGVFPIREATIPIDDARLERAYVVRTGGADDLEALCAAASALVFLHDRRKGVWIASDGTKVSVSWRGLESDPLVLDAARDAAVLVAGWHRSETPYR